MEREFILNMVVREALTFSWHSSNDLKEVNKTAIQEQNIPDRGTASTKAVRENVLGLFKTKSDGCGSNGVRGKAG